MCPAVGPGNDCRHHVERLVIDPIGDHFTAHASIEQLLRQTHADQGGDCTFERWLDATADADADAAAAEYMHADAKIFDAWLSQHIRDKSAYLSYGDITSEGE